MVNAYPKSADLLSSYSISLETVISLHVCPCLSYCYTELVGKIERRKPCLSEFSRPKSPNIYIFVDQ